jgi:hypothetical protein
MFISNNKNVVKFLKFCEWAIKDLGSRFNYSCFINVTNSQLFQYDKNKPFG